MASVFTKSKASTLAKIAALPRYRSPKDLLNEPHLPYGLQIKQINAVFPWKTGKYLSNEHYQLCTSSESLRRQYRKAQEPESRQTLSVQNYLLWSKYMRHWLTKPATQLSEEQKQHIYEAMLTAKERNEERLSLHRFVKFGYEYSQAFKVDLPLNPVVMMKMVHPHFGYLSNIPNLSHFKYTHEQLFVLISEFIAASQVRQLGYTLHSSEMVSFIFWKILAQNQARLPADQFLQLLKTFKFDLSESTYKKELAYSLKRGELIKSDSRVGFNVLRQLFLDRDL